MECRFAEVSGEAFHHATAEGYYRQEYFAVLDMVTACVEEWFDQPGYKVVTLLESVLLKAAVGKQLSDKNVDKVLAHVGDDVSRSGLVSQLETLTAAMSATTHPSIRDIQGYLQTLSPSQRLNLSEVCTLLKIVLVSPATNAVSERSASALRRVKTYLRSTMSQERLNYLLLLHSHKSRTDGLNLDACLQEFVDSRDHHKDVFGKFY